MTLKLYDQNSHQTQATARVITCTPAENGFDVLLDQTVLFPEGGGQPCDTGWIGDARVLSCREDHGEVVHTTDRALTVGETVSVRLDWARRFDFMQQHTGEHLLSFSFYKLFEAANIGFHLALDYATIDFDMPLSREQIAEAELLANSYVWRNLPVMAAFYDSEEDVKSLPLRKHAEGLTAPIRIVSIEDADMCTCCAPHCALTGEIGSIFVLDAAGYKGGTRVTFLCGERALRRHRAEHDDLDAVARRFSTSRENAVSAVAKLSDEYGALKRRERELAKELNGFLSNELRSNAKQAGKFRVSVRLFSGMDAGRLKDLAQCAAEPGVLAVLFSQVDGKLSYVLASGEKFPLDVGELIPAVNAATGGKGGGRGTLAQGMAQSDS
ncbi:MAG TPA: alanyl-tRNA editing protein, partial [Candidatus Cryosericum sp.]|nr:alanyl-tRNA editing protein [Candidatus Cryosericum sp.]